MRQVASGKPERMVVLCAVVPLASIITKSSSTSLVSLSTSTTVSSLPSAPVRAITSASVGLICFKTDI
ncbi:hypothetical protein H3L91_04505 [Neisseria bacilliformis]|nr:hypothetical protein H3L91_04505 [Neisseria bacilliformis]